MSARSGALAAVVAVIWGLCFVLIQAGLPSPAPLLLAGLRALIGGLVLAAWIALTRGWPRIRRPGGPSSPSGSWTSGLPRTRELVVLALANATVAFGAMYLAAGRAEAAAASILAGGQPVILAAAGWALFAERLTPRTAAGLAVSMGGVVLVATTSSGATSPDGVALALLATAAPAAGTVVMRRLGSSIDLLATTSAQFLLGGAILVAASALVEPWSGLTWSLSSVASLLVLGVVGTGVAYVVWFWLLGRSRLSQLGAALFLVPVVGVVGGILVGDRPTLAELAGILAVLAGIGLASVPRREAITVASGNPT